MAFKFKSQQVLRTRIPLKAERGEKLVPPETRVVVTSITEDGKVRVRTENGRFLEARVSSFETTRRGRPRIVKRRGPGRPRKHEKVEA